MSWYERTEVGEKMQLADDGNSVAGDVRCLRGRGGSCTVAAGSHTPDACRLRSTAAHGRAFEINVRATS